VVFLTKLETAGSLMASIWLYIKSSIVQSSLYWLTGFLFFALPQSLEAKSAGLSEISASLETRHRQYIVHGNNVGDEHLDITHNIAAPVNIVLCPSLTRTTG
jgi:hypothetical protein